MKNLLVEVVVVMMIHVPLLAEVILVGVPDHLQVMIPQVREVTLAGHLHLVIQAVVIQVGVVQTPALIPAAILAGKTLTQLTLIKKDKTS
jgi:hypothetical protein